MIDALLYAVRDAIRKAGFGYDSRTCEIMASGHPKPDAGDCFVAVHQKGQSSDMMNALDEYYGFCATLTMRCSNVPPDRVGDRLLAKSMAENNGFNGRAQQLKAYLHMNWGVIGDANNNMIARAQAAGIAVIHGFAQPAMFKGMDDPRFEGDDWLGLETGEDGNLEVALVAELRFDGARRLQPIAEYA